MNSETKEIMKSDVIQKFEYQLRGLKLSDGVYKPVFSAVLKDEHISTIISILEMYVNDVVKSSNIDVEDAYRTCLTLHENMTDWFFLNWGDIEPKRMTREQIIFAMTSLVFATWKCADKGTYRKDLFGNPISKEAQERPFR